MDERLTQEQGQQLLEFARKTIACKLGLGENPVVPSDPLFSQNYATFVTLNIDAKLRGCIGNLEPVGSLLDGVQSNALNAAFHDTRFPALTEGEFQAVHLHISILSRPTSLSYSGPEDLTKKLRPGVDGVILRDGRYGATFLPQVWEQLPRIETFLGQLCLKAGIAKNSWRERPLEIQTYQVQAFAEDKP